MKQLIFLIFYCWLCVNHIAAQAVANCPRDLPNIKCANSTEHGKTQWCRCRETCERVELQCINGTWLYNELYCVDALPEAFQEVHQNRRNPMDKIILYFTPPNTYVLKCPGNSTAPVVPGKCVNGTYIFPPIYHSCLDDTSSCIHNYGDQIVCEEEEKQQNLTAKEVVCSPVSWLTISGIVVTCVTLSVVSVVLTLKIKQMSAGQASLFPFKFSMLRDQMEEVDACFDVRDDGENDLRNSQRMVH